MVFSSNVFLFVFLPAFLALYYLTKKNFRSYVILLGSYVFYAWWRVDFLSLMIAVSVFSYWASVRIHNTTDEQARRRWMWVGVFGNLCVLGYFKYFNFLFDNINAAMAAFHGDQFNVWHVILPIGISFYIFQSVSYVIDVYRRDVPPAARMIDFMAFTSLFPQLIAGPVLRYKDLADQFVYRPQDWATFAQGCFVFAVGFSKKVLIADTIAPVVTMTFDQRVNPSLIDAWLGALAYTIQLYFDFSGYSDMAIGLGLMIGFKFIQNFDKPYISRSITEFWRRWHISLSTWLRDYLYIPLGGNRKGPVRTYVNLLLTMVLGGFWHGANWTFILWGTWHGAWMVFERKLGAKGKASVYPKLVALPFTFLLVVIGWVMFRATSVDIAFDMYGGMIGLHGFALSDALSWQVTGLQISTLVLGFGIVWGVPAWSHFAGSRIAVVGPQRMLELFIVPIFILAVLKLSAQSYTPFLYFQF